MVAWDEGTRFTQVYCTMIEDEISEEDMKLKKLSYPSILIPALKKCRALPKDSTYALYYIAPGKINFLISKLYLSFIQFQNPEWCYSRKTNDCLSSISRLNTSSLTYGVMLISGSIFLNPWS